MSPCLFNLYAEYIKGNVRLDEAQLKSRLLGEKSIIIFKYVDDTTVMAESKEEL